MMIIGENPIRIFFCYGFKEEIMVSGRREDALYIAQRIWYLFGYSGNKWAVIASMMTGKDDSAVKNKFYSTLRKGLRKVNSYIANVKKKTDPIKYKAFKPFP